MHKPWVRAVMALLFPAGCLVLAGVGLLWWGVLPGPLPGALPIYPYLIGFAVALLGWRFGSSRVVFAAIVLALAEVFLAAFARGDAAMTRQGEIAFDSVSLLLPLDLISLVTLKESGLLSKRGLGILGGIAVQASLIFIMGLVPDARLVAFLSHRFPEGGPLGNLALSTPALAAFAAAFLILSILFAMRREVLDAGFLWALVACATALAPGSPGPQSTLLLAVGALALGVSVIEAGHRMAFRDDLTGLPGRRALNEALGRLGGSYAVAMVDVDHFKAFNDRHGHDVGDQVLKLVAARLGAVGGGGTAYRYGGEEFAVLFQDKSAAGARASLEAAREAIAASGLTLRSPDRSLKKPSKPKARGGVTTVSVTVSVGLAEGKAGADATAALKAADHALYRAKRTGRNCLCG